MLNQDYISYNNMMTREEVKVIDSDYKNLDPFYNWKNAPTNKVLRVTLIDGSEKLLDKWAETPTQITGVILSNRNNPPIGRSIPIRITKKYITSMTILSYDEWLGGLF